MSAEPSVLEHALWLLGVKVERRRAALEVAERKRHKGGDPMVAAVVATREVQKANPSWFGKVRPDERLPDGWFE